MCLIPEIPYDIQKVKAALDRRFHKDRGFAVVVISEGAYPENGEIVFKENYEVGYENIKLGGALIRRHPALNQTAKPFPE